MANYVVMIGHNSHNDNASHDIHNTIKEPVYNPSHWNGEGGF